MSTGKWRPIQLGLNVINRPCTDRRYTTLKEALTLSTRGLSNHKKAPLRCQTYEVINVAEHKSLTPLLLGHECSDLKMIHEICQELPHYTGRNYNLMSRINKQEHKCNGSCLVQVMP